MSDNRDTWEWLTDILRAMLPGISMALAFYNLIVFFRAFQFNSLVLFFLLFSISIHAGAHTYIDFCRDKDDDEDEWDDEWDEEDDE